MPEAGRELKLRQRRDSANILGGLALGYLHTMIAKSLSYRTCIAGSIEIKKKKRYYILEVFTSISSQNDPFILFIFVPTL